MTDAAPVPIAGPVFTEWYWGPIFFAIVYGPPIAAIAGGLVPGRALHAICGAAPAPPRRWRSPRRSCSAAWPPTPTVKHRRTEAADASAVTFAAFAAPDLHQTRAEVYPGYGPSCTVRYERGGRRAVGDPGGGGGRRPDAAAVPSPTTARRSTPGRPVRGRRTPRGAARGASSRCRSAPPASLDVRDGTLIVASARAPADEADLLALADALRPVDVDEIHWER